MKIYVRKDLNMRKGKISAQSAHAALSLWTNAMEYSEDEISMTGTNLTIFNEWNDQGQPIEIVPVESVNDLVRIELDNRKNSSIIVDNGRTEFKGELTPTCIAVCDNKNLNSTLLNRDNIEVENFNTKQVFVANKNFKADKWELAEHLSRSSINAIFKESIFFSDEPRLSISLYNKYLKSWLLNSFPKIVLQAKENECLDLIEKLKENENMILDIANVKNQIACVTLGGDFVDNINPYTSKFKLF